MERNLITNAVKSIMGVGLSRIMSTSRLQEVVFARMVMAKELFSRTTMTKEEIAEYMNKSPKMVQYYIERYDIDVKSYRQFTLIADEVTNYLNDHEEQL